MLSLGNKREILQYSLATVGLALVINLIPRLFKKKKIKAPLVTGSVEPGWELVKEVYQKLFDDDDDRGSSLAVYHKGQLVVDLKGGFADERELLPWQDDTLTRIFSTSKGVAAVCVALLVDRGLIEYDEPVKKYWPEFGVNGKENITVEMLISHQAGVAAITSDSYTLWDEVNDIDKLGRLLAEQHPLWKPGSGVGYHGMTIGFYMDQLIRHADPKRRGIPQFFREEIAEPFGIDIYFGLPDAEAYRMAAMERMSSKLKYFLLPYVREMYYNFIFTPKDPDVAGLFERMLAQYTDPNIGSVLYRRRPDVHKLWNPSAFGYGSGKSLAKLFGILANGGSHEGKTLISEKTIEGQTKIVKEGRDKVMMKVLVPYGRGYRMFMSPKNTPMFGSPGAGGQMGYADPANKLALGFATNYLTFMGSRDLRYRALEKAIYQCLDKSGN